MEILGILPQFKKIKEGVKISKTLNVATESGLL